MGTACVRKQRHVQFNDDVSVHSIPPRTMERDPRFYWPEPYFDPNLAEDDWDNFEPYIHDPAYINGTDSLGKKKINTKAQGDGKKRPAPTAPANAIRPQQKPPKGKGAGPSQPAGQPHSLPPPASDHPPPVMPRGRLVGKVRAARGAVCEDEVAQESTSPARSTESSTEEDTVAAAGNIDANTAMSQETSAMNKDSKTGSNNSVDCNTTNELQESTLNLQTQSESNTLAVDQPDCQKPAIDYAGSSPDRKETEVEDSIPNRSEGNNQAQCTTSQQDTTCLPSQSSEIEEGVPGPTVTDYRNNPGNVVSRDSTPTRSDQPPSIENKANPIQTFQKPPETSQIYSLYVTPVLHNDKESQSKTPATKHSTSQNSPKSVSSSRPRNKNTLEARTNASKLKKNMTESSKTLCELVSPKARQTTVQTSKRKNLSGISQSTVEASKHRSMRLRGQPDTFRPMSRKMKTRTNAGSSPRKEETASSSAKPSPTERTSHSTSRFPPNSNRRGRHLHNSKPTHGPKGEKTTVKSQPFVATHTIAGISVQRSSGILEQSAQSGRKDSEISKKDSRTSHPTSKAGRRHKHSAINRSRVPKSPTSSSGNKGCKAKELPCEDDVLYPPSRNQSKCVTHLSSRSGHSLRSSGSKASVGGSQISLFSHGSTRSLDSNFGRDVSSEFSMCGTHLNRRDGYPNVSSSATNIASPYQRSTKITAQGERSSRNREVNGAKLQASGSSSNMSKRDKNTATKNLSSRSRVNSASSKKGSLERGRGRGVGLVGSTGLCKQKKVDSGNKSLQLSSSKSTLGTVTTHGLKGDGGGNVRKGDGPNDTESQKNKTI